MKTLKQLIVYVVGISAVAAQTTFAHSVGGIDWPEATAFQESAQQTSAKLQHQEVLQIPNDELAASLQQSLEAGKALAAAKPPAKVADSLAVSLLLKDLNTLTSQSTVPSVEDADSLVDELATLADSIVERADVHQPEGPHHGVVVELPGSSPAFAEIKLHDDKGDLEVWLSTDSAIRQPLDLPLDATLSLRILDADDQTVTLAVRNRTENEDEDGQPNIRDEATNYFIFPGDTGADASWLQGGDFRSAAVLTITVDGKELQTDVFTLRPHVH